MFIGKSYDFLKKRLAKKLLLPLAGYMVFCQNPAVYGGLVINNENAPSAIFAQNMDYELAYDGTDYVDTSDGAGIDGAVVIILDSAEQLIAGFTVGGEVLAVAAGDGGITDQDKIADFYSSNGLNFDGSTNDDFAEADKLAIIDVTSNNLTLAMLESTDVLRGNILKLDGNFNFQLGSVEYGGGVQGIEGSVDTGAGNDELTFDNGAIAGYVNLRDGDNTVTMEGTAIIGWFEYGGTELTTGLTTGSGNDIIQIIDQSHIVGDVYTGEGDDTITIDGTYGAYAGLDDDFTENNIWAGIRNYAVDNDPDPFVDDFEIVGGNLNLGNGDNTLTMLGQSEISGNLIAGSGIDTVTLSGTNITDYDAFVLGDQTAYASHIVGNVYLGAGNDVMTLNGDSFIGDLDNYIVIDDEAIAGDPVTDDADTGNVYLGAGNDSLTLNDDSSIFGDANGDAGNDTIILNNNSSVLGNIDGGDGNDTITLNGNSFVDNDIDGGDGNDIITVNSAASIGGAVLGSGNDQLFYSGINDAVDIATTSGSNFVVLSGVDLVGGSLAGGSANGTAVTRSFDGNSYTFTGDYFLFDDSTSNDGSIFDMNNGSDYTLHLINGSSITDSISLDGDNNTLILDDTSSVVGDVSLDNTSTVKLRGNSVIDGDLTDDATADNITISFEDSAQIDGNVTFNDDPTNVTFNLSGTGEKVTGTITLDADSNNTVNFTNLTSDAGTNFSNFNMDHVDTFKATGGETITLAADETLGAAGKDITFTLSGASFNMGGNTLTLAGDTNKLIFQSSSTFTAATVTGSGNVDTITLTGNSTANADFNLGAGDDIVNLNNSTINGEIDGEGGTDTINLQGSGSLGAITTLTAIENLNVKDAAIWNINSNHTVATFTIEDGGTATVNNGSTLTADVVADGVLNIANGATFNGLTVNGTLTHQSTSDLTASSLNLTNSSTINVLYDGTGSSEILLGGGAVTDVDGINVSIDTADALLENGDTISIIRNATSIDSNFYNSTSDSFFQTFNFVTGSSANNLIATVERTAYNDLDCPVAENLNAMLTQLEAVRSTMTGSTEFAEFEKGTQADFEEQAAQINPS
ncbi:MAG: hypothetical protein MK132_18350, partial [Lentisphaerales bacterium]|nr:hypothetical protein [Lentisphaerales bacterium]